MSGIPSSACLGTSRPDNPVQRQSHLHVGALRTRGGRLRSSFVPWELSLLTACTVNKLLMSRKLYLQ